MIPSRPAPGGRLLLLFLLVLTGSGHSRAGPRQAEQLFLKSCSLMKTAEQVQSDGPDGDSILDACLFSRKKPVPFCARMLGVPGGLVQVLRSNRKYLRIAGSPMTGFAVGLSEALAATIERADPLSPYVDAVRLRMRIGEVADKLRLKDFLEESDRRRAAGKAPLQWGGVPPRVDPSDLLELQIRYAVLLKNELQRAPPGKLARCLEEQLQSVLPAYRGSDEGRLRTRLEDEAQVIATSVKNHLRLDRNWKTVILHLDQLHGYLGRLAAVSVVFENRRKWKREEFLDERMRIFPWFQVVLADPGFALQPGVVPEQPVVAAEPEADRRPFECFGRNDRFQLCLRWGMLPFFRDDHESLIGVLREEHALNAPAQPAGLHDWRIVPGERVGPVMPASCEKDLAALFGGKNLAPADVPLGEGLAEPGTVVYDSSADARLWILWKDKQARCRPAEIRFRGTSSRWKTAEGVSLGTTLRELERINGRPFKLSGFEWDYEGSVTSWEGGKLEKAFVREIGTGVMMLLGTIRLSPTLKGRVMPRDPKAMEQVLGDQEFDSSHPAMQKLDPGAWEFIVVFPP